MHSQSDLSPRRHEEAFSSSSSSRCPMYLAMRRQSSSSNMYIVTGGYPLCLRDIDLFTNRIRLDLIEPIRWFPSGTLLCTYERYYFKVNRFSFWNPFVLERDAHIQLPRRRRRRRGKQEYVHLYSIGRRELIRLMLSIDWKMNGSMVNRRNYSHALLHYSVIWPMQVTMSLNYYLDQKRSSIYRTSLCPSRKKPVRTFLSSIASEWNDVRSVLRFYRSKSISFYHSAIDLSTGQFRTNFSIIWQRFPSSSPF